MPPVSGPAWPILTVTVSLGGRGRGAVGGFGRLLRLFLAAAVEGDERGGDERQAELAVKRAWIYLRGDGGKGITVNY